MSRVLTVNRVGARSGMPVPELPYESWKQQAMRPIAKAIASWRLPLSRTPMLPPPPDPQWPTPHTEEHLSALLDRLPHRQAIVCATVAAEHVLPLWERWAYSVEVDEAAPDDPAVVARALASVQAWQRCESALARVEALLPQLDRACSRPNGHTHASLELAACEAARSVQQLCKAVLAGAPVVGLPVGREILRAVLSAYYAWVFAYDEPMIWWDNADGRQWLTELWWSRCRARLAFADATTAELR